MQNLYLNHSLFIFVALLALPESNFLLINQVFNGKSFLPTSLVVRIFFSERNKKP
jgi:hypothetical protein